MIKIRLVPFIQRHIGEVAVIRVLLDKHNIPRADRLDDLPRYRCLARTCSPADADYHFYTLPQRRRDAEKCEQKLSSLRLRVSAVQFILTIIRLSNSSKTSATRAPVSIT